MSKKGIYSGGGTIYTQNDLAGYEKSKVTRTKKTQNDVVEECKKRWRVSSNEESNIRRGKQSPYGRIENISQQLIDDLKKIYNVNIELFEHKLSSIIYLKRKNAFTKLGYPKYNAGHLVDIVKKPGQRRGRIKRGNEVLNSWSKTLESISDDDSTKRLTSSQINKLDDKKEENKKYFLEFLNRKKSKTEEENSILKIFGDLPTKLPKVNGPFNEDGFNEDGFHESTNTLYDPDGFDLNGFDENGYDTYGYNKEGFDSYGYDEEGFNLKGYNFFGIDRNNFDTNGIHTITGIKFNEDGYNCYGFNKFGFHKLTKERYDEKSFDKRGINIQTNKKNDLFGFDRFGIHKDTGLKYDKNGFDIFGFNREGIHEYTKTEYNNAGFDRNGYHKDTKIEFNLDGFNTYGVHKVTQKRINLQGYSMDEARKNSVELPPFDPETFITEDSECVICKLKGREFLTIGVLKPKSKLGVNEKKDSNNYIPLCHNHNHLLKEGLISFQDNGRLIISGRISLKNKKILSLNNPITLDEPKAKEKYIKYHRTLIYNVI